MKKNMLVALVLIGCVSGIDARRGDWHKPAFLQALGAIFYRDQWTAIDNHWNNHNSVLTVPKEIALIKSYHGWTQVNAERATRREKELYAEGVLKKIVNRYELCSDDNKFITNNRSFIVEKLNSELTFYEYLNDNKNYQTVQKLSQYIAHANFS